MASQWVIITYSLSAWWNTNPWAAAKGTWEARANGSSSQMPRFSSVLQAVERERGREGGREGGRVYV